MAKLSLSPNSASNKRTQGKLSLNKETLASLGDRDLESVHGGTYQIGIPAVGVGIGIIIIGGGLALIGTKIVQTIAISVIDGCIRVPYLDPNPLPRPKESVRPIICKWSEQINCTEHCVTIVRGMNCIPDGVGYA